eukprot:gene39786-52510_t
MISNGWPGGFGSVAHVEGLTLAIAMELGRVLLPHPDGPVRGPPRDLGWHYDQDHSEERCLAMHIRRGDKGIEMDLIALEEYLSA